MLTLLGTILVLVLTTYLIQVRRKRFQRISNLLKKYPDASLCLSDLNIAQEVFSTTMYLEFPWMMTFLVQPNVTFKTNAVPGITKVLVATRQLTKEPEKRFEDTDLLFGEMHEGYARRVLRQAERRRQGGQGYQAQNKEKVTTGTSTSTSTGTGMRPLSRVDSKDEDEETHENREKEREEREEDERRAQEAIDRVKFLHSHYKIGQEEYLYTLSVFVLECFRWIDGYEWRALTTLEKNAIFAIWTDTGRRIGIEDIPPTIEQLHSWQKDFESRHLTFAPSNHLLTKTLLDLITSPFPTQFRPLIQTSYLALIFPPVEGTDTLSGNRFRVACGVYEEDDDQRQKTEHLSRVMQSVLWIRGRLVRYGMLPRKEPLIKTGLWSSAPVAGVDAAASSSLTCPMSGKAGTCPVSHGKDQEGQVEEEKKKDMGGEGIYIPRETKTSTGMTLYPKGYKIHDLGPARFLGKRL